MKFVGMMNSGDVQGGEMSAMVAGEVLARIANMLECDTSAALKVAMRLARGTIG